MPSIDEVVRLTNKKPMAINAICLKLAINEGELKRLVRKGQEEGYSLLWLDGFVATRTAVGPVNGSYIHRKDAPPGRYVVAHMTDTHAGSKHYLAKDHLAFLWRAWHAGARVMLSTGDHLDGHKDVLTADQTRTGLDDQAGILRDTLSKGPNFKYLTISGNHDGYFDSKIGFASGKYLETFMAEKGVRWVHLGQCKGDANVYGAQFRLWHPMGGASTRNALRRILNAQAERMAEKCDSILMGHFHKHAPVYVYEENMYCASGGTFQGKASEFANRITGEWDIGGSLIHFTRKPDGSVGEFSSEFLPAVR